MAKILISGGSGFVGKTVTGQLQALGHTVAWLSRKGGKKGNVEIYAWDPVKGTMDPSAFSGVEHIIHLAGANIIGKRWTRRYKERILASRVRSSELLYRQMVLSGANIRSFTGASAVGYYGAIVTDKTFSETDRPGTDFLAKVCVAWEHGYEPFRNAGIRTTIIRTAIVLDREGGALKKMLPVFRAGLGAAVAPGRQAFPWITRDDLAAVYVKSCFDVSMSGVYNAAAPDLVTARTFSRELAAQLHRPFWLPNVPELVLRLALGEAASTLTTGVQVSSSKLAETGFEFRHARLGPALAYALKTASALP